MVADAPDIETVLPEVMKFCEGCIMVAHNASFDMSFIRENCRRQGLADEFTVVDTLGMARSMFENLKNYKLDTVVEAVGGSLELITGRLMTRNLLRIFCEIVGAF